MRPEHPVPMCRICVRHRFLRPLRRRWPLWVALSAAVLLVTTRFVELRQLGATLAEGHWGWLLAGVLLQGVYYASYAVLYKAGYATVGVTSRVREIIPVLMTSILIGTFTPAGGLSSAAVMVDDAARRQQSAARATEGILLVWLASLAASLPLLAIGLGYLHLQGLLEAYQFGAALAFLLYTGGLFAVLFLAKWRPDWLRMGLDRLQGLIDGLLTRLHRPTLNEGWAENNAAEATGAVTAITKRPGLVAVALAVALGTHLINLASLQAVFLAFGHMLGFGALAAAYTLGFVFSVVSIIPFDLGVLAGLMTLVYSSMGVPTAHALVVSLAFRGINAWLPIALGFLLFRRVLRNRDSGSADE